MSPKMIWSAVGCKTDVASHLRSSAIRLRLHSVQSCDLIFTTRKRFAVWLLPATETAIVVGRGKGRDGVFDDVVLNIDEK